MLIDLGYNVEDEDGIKNIDVIVARLLVLSASGNLQAMDKLLKIAGYDSEENRAERESVNADRRKDRESEARLLAIERGDMQRVSSSYTDGDEDSSVEDVFIYLPDNGRDKDLLNTGAVVSGETGIDGGGELDGEDTETAGRPSD